MRNPFGTYLKHAFGNQYNYIAMALFGGLGVLLDPGWLMIGVRTRWGRTHPSSFFFTSSASLMLKLVSAV